MTTLGQSGHPTTRANSSRGQADGLLEERRATSLGLSEMTGIEASLAALRQIFLDAEAPPRARIEAAETILSYEAPADLIQEARGFLIEVLQDQEMSVSLRLEASKVLRKAEAPKIQNGPVASVDKVAEREMARDILKAKRRLAIHLAGLWPPPPGYCADLDAADFDPVAALEAQTEAERAEKERLAAEKASKNKKKDR